MSENQFVKRFFICAAGVASLALGGCGERANGSENAVAGSEAENIQSDTSSESELAQTNESKSDQLPDSEKMENLRKALAGLVQCSMAYEDYYEMLQNKDTTGMSIKSLEDENVKIAQLIQNTSLVRTYMIKIENKYASLGQMDNFAKYKTEDEAEYERNTATPESKYLVALKIVSLCNENLAQK